MASAAAGVPVIVVCSVEYQQQQAAVESSTSLHRRSANYQASTWDYDSICSLREEEAGESVLQLQATTLKERVRRLLLQEREDDDTAGRSRLGIIHRLQSLGIAYHFQEEIKGILLSMHRAAPSNLDDDLHSAALLFRMLRAQGIPASTDMLLVMMRAFRFREEDEVVVGSDDDDGLLALYEASYLAFPGETELEEARAFAVQSLAARGGGIAAGHLPLHWRAPRLQAMWSLHEEQAGADDDDDDILQLARVDFNLVQALHRRELAEVTRWWKESRLGERLPFARDRVVECFFCAACIAPEPHLADCREVLAKTGSLIVHLDDIYDVYGTPEELRAFTDAIATWEPPCGAGDALPEYMRTMYAAIWETSTTAADRVLSKHGCHVLPLFKKQWHELCKAFLVEARWHQRSYRPSFREYLANGWVTSTGPLLLLHALPAAGAAAVGSDGDRLLTTLVELSSTIFRLCNDCASHEAESQRGDAPSAIACCMEEAWCAGEEQARAAVQGLIADTWKVFNKEMSSSADQSMAVAADLCRNLARIIHCIYQDGDGITSPTHRMKRMVKDLLFNPVIVGTCIGNLACRQLHIVCRMQVLQDKAIY
ncbi:hypothetical protein GQ55_2G001900 [Panicum hallii var. hallii]|uniref:Uncharacterized protein n=1 Tax=Panicum hallii var. hallii TaxID=1504633 RepID=A0A2T7EK10_9POAL|nr:hypothetical protein GQ55_2G001900 [Panicum hallii var. hallii]